MSAKTKRSLKVLIAAVILAVMPVVGAHAIFVNPVTIVLKDKDVATRVTINNRSNKPKLIKLSWERRAQLADGTMVKLNEGDENPPGYRPADPYVKFSPRQFVLQPKTYQKVRMVAMRPGDMAPGEYHSHLLIEEFPVDASAAATAAAAAEGGEDAEEAAKVAEASSKGGFGGRIELRINKSTPVFLLTGETKIDLAVEHANVVMLDGKPQLDVAVTNESTRSIYVQVIADCKGADGALTSENIFMMRIYAEAKRVANAKPFKTIDPKQCSALDMRLVGAEDFEYDGKTIMKVPVGL